MIRRMFRAPIVFIPEIITTSAQAGRVAFQTEDPQEFAKALRFLRRSR
jgi:hypothetical protein